MLIFLIFLIEISVCILFSENIEHLEDSIVLYPNLVLYSR